MSEYEMAPIVDPATFIGMVRKDLNSSFPTSSSLALNPGLSFSQL
jgi:hypothetical protein